MNKETIKNVLIVLAVIICIPLLYKLLSAIIPVIVILILGVAGYFIGWPWLKRKFGGKQ